MSNRTIISIWAMICVSVVLIAGFLTVGNIRGHTLNNENAKNCYNSGGNWVVNMDNTRLCLRGPVTTASLGLTP